MRKFLAIPALVCLFLNITGYQTIFYLQQQELKGQMTRAIRAGLYAEQEKDFVYVLRDEKAMNEFRWEGDHEFSFRGEMYDVIEKKIDHGRVIVRAVADKDETTLLVRFAAMNKDPNRGLALLLQLLGDAYTMPAALAICANGPGTAPSACPVGHWIFSFPPDTPTPPPWSIQLHGDDDHSCRLQGLEIRFFS